MAAPEALTSFGKESLLLYYATIFLVVGSIAWAMNVARIAMVATQSAWTLLVSGIVLMVIHLMTKDMIRAS